jgi:hypothetical protein
MAVQAQHLAHAFHHDSRAIRFVTTAHAPCLASPRSCVLRSPPSPTRSGYLSVSDLPAGQPIDSSLARRVSQQASAERRHDGRGGVPPRTRRRPPVTTTLRGAAAAGRRQHCVQRPAQRAHLQQQPPSRQRLLRAEEARADRRRGGRRPDHGRPPRAAARASAAAAGVRARGGRAGQGPLLRRRVHQRAPSRLRADLAQRPVVSLPPQRRDRRVRSPRGALRCLGGYLSENSVWSCRELRSTIASSNPVLTKLDFCERAEREAALGSGGGAAPARARRGVGLGARGGAAPAGGGGRPGARPGARRGARRAAPAGGRRGPGVAGHRQRARGRRRGPARHARPAPPPGAAPGGRGRGRGRGRAVVLLRAGAGGRPGLRRRRRREQGVVPVVRRGGRVRAAAAVPAPVPVRRVRGGRGGVPRLRGHQERLAPRPLVVTSSAPAAAQRIDSSDRSFIPRSRPRVFFLPFSLSVSRLEPDDQPVFFYGLPASV